MSLEEAPVTDAPKLIGAWGVVDGWVVAGELSLGPASSSSLWLPSCCPGPCGTSGSSAVWRRRAGLVLGLKGALRGGPGNLQVGSHVYFFPPQNVSKFRGSVPKVEKCV